MQGFATRYIRDEKLIPISWEQAQALLKTKATDDAYFTVSFYVLSRAVLIFAALKKRLEPEDLSAVCTVWRGHPFIVAAVKKRALPAAQYRALVRCLIGVEGAGLEDGCTDVWAPVWAMDLAAELSLNLLTDRPADEDLAMAA